MNEQPPNYTAIPTYSYTQPQGYNYYMPTDTNTTYSIPRPYYGTDVKNEEMKPLNDHVVTIQTNSIMDDGKKFWNNLRIKNKLIGVLVLTILNFVLHLWLLISPFWMYKNGTYYGLITKLHNGNFKLIENQIMAQYRYVQVGMYFLVFIIPFTEIYALILLYQNRGKDYIYKRLRHIKTFSWSGVFISTCIVAIFISIYELDVNIRNLIELPNTYIFISASTILWSLEGLFTAKYKIESI